MTDLEIIHEIWEAYDEIMDHTSLTESKDIIYQISDMTDIDEKIIKRFFKVIDTAEKSITDRLFIGEISINEASDLMKNNKKQPETVEKISLWDLGEDARKLKDSLIHIETDKRKYKAEIHSWIINHLFDGVSCEDIARQLSSVFDKDYNIMLTAVYARKEEVNKRVVAANLIKLDLDLEENNNKQLKTMNEVRFYSEQEEKEILEIAKDANICVNDSAELFAKKYKRSANAVKVKIYNTRKTLSISKNIRFYSKKEIIDCKKHLVLTAPHPSPLSAYRGFLGCKHFSQTNQYFRELGITEINW